MAKTAYIGVNSKAQKIKKIYVGVNGVARKVKKGYIGVNGVARKFFGGLFGYYGNISSYGGPGQWGASMSNDNYLILANGYSSNAYIASNSAVLAFTPSLVETQLTIGAYPFTTGAALENYFIWGLGTTRYNPTWGDTSTYRAVSSSTAKCLDSTLTEVNISSPSTSVGARGAAGAAVANNTLCYFAGGSYYYSDSSTSMTSINRVHSYNTSLTLQTGHTTLSSNRDNLGCSFAGYAIFGPGWINNTSNYIDTYDEYGTKGTMTAFSTSRIRYAVTALDSYLLYSGSESSNVVDVYNTSLTRLTPRSLTSGRSYLSATTLDKYAIFAGGTYSTSVDIIDDSLTLTTTQHLSNSNIMAGTIGDYAIVGVGSNYGITMASADVYTLD